MRLGKRERMLRRLAYESLSQTSEDRKAIIKHNLSTAKPEKPLDYGQGRSVYVNFKAVVFKDPRGNLFKR